MLGQGYIQQGKKKDQETEKKKNLIRFMKVEFNNVSFLSIPVYAGNFPEISHEISIFLVESASIQKSHNFG